MEVDALPALVLQVIAEEIVTSSGRGVEGLVDGADAEELYGALMAMRDVQALWLTSHGVRAALGVPTALLLQSSAAWKRMSYATEIVVETAAGGPWRISAKATADADELWEVVVMQHVRRTYGEITADAAFSGVVRHLPTPDRVRGALRAVVGPDLDAAKAAYADGCAARARNLSAVLEAHGYYPDINNARSSYVTAGHRVETLRGAAFSAMRWWDKRFGKQWRSTVQASALTCDQAVMTWDHDKVNTSAFCWACGEAAEDDTRLTGCEASWVKRCDRDDRCRDDEYVVYVCSSCPGGPQDDGPVRFRCGCVTAIDGSWGVNN